MFNADLAARVGNTQCGSQEVDAGVEAAGDDGEEEEIVAVEEDVVEKEEVEEEEVDESEVGGGSADDGVRGGAVTALENKLVSETAGTEISE